MKQVLLAPFLILLRSQRFAAWGKAWTCCLSNPLGSQSMSGGLEKEDASWGQLGLHRRPCHKKDGTYSQHPFPNVCFIYKKILRFFFKTVSLTLVLRTLILIIIIYYCVVTIYYRKIKALLTLVQKISQVPAPSSLTTQRRSVNFLPALKAVCLPVSSILSLAFVFSPAQPCDTLPGFNQCPLH